MVMEMLKMWKANDGRRTTGHGISWPGEAPSELMNVKMIAFGNNGHTTE